MAEAPQPFEIAIAEPVLDDLRERLARTRWPSQPDGARLGDAGPTSATCARSASTGRPTTTGARSSARSTASRTGRWDGIHFIWERAGGVAAPERLPVILIHGWPGGADRVPRADPAAGRRRARRRRPVAAGLRVLRRAAAPLNVAEIAGAARALMSEALGYERYAVQGGDWGSEIGARMAFDDPDSVAAFHTNAPGDPAAARRPRRSTPERGGAELPRRGSGAGGGAAESTCWFRDPPPTRCRRG